METIMSMQKARAMLTTGNAVFIGNYKNPNGGNYALIEDLDRKIMYHVSDPNYHLENYKSRALPAKE